MRHSRNKLTKGFLGLLLLSVWLLPAEAVVQFYGDIDCVGAGCLGDPNPHIPLEGLAPGVSMLDTQLDIRCCFSWFPSPSDHPGTDQSYNSSGWNGGCGEFFCSFGTPGPQVVILDYSALVPSGHVVTSLTLGLAMVDFQFPQFGRAYTASVNGVPNGPLSAICRCKMPLRSSKPKRFVMAISSCLRG